MKFSGFAGAIFALAVVGGVQAAGVDAEAVPLYTSEDLDRMFGPVPAGPSVPTDTTKPEDWRWVEQFIDRQYARVDADRQYDLDRRERDIAAREPDPGWTGYGQPLAWGLGYPASTWWNTVWGQYARSVYSGYRAPGPAVRRAYARPMGETTHRVGGMTPRGDRPGGGHGSAHVSGHGNGHRSQ